MDFSKIWASNGNVSAPTDAQYLQGFEFLGSAPPTVELFNYLFQMLDLKAKALKDETFTLFRQSSTEYAVGDIRLPSDFGYKYLECAVAGTSATTEPTWTAVGSTVTDGTVTWIVRDLRVGTAIGKIPALVDVGGGVAGLPAVSGKLLTDISGMPVWGANTVYVVGDVRFTMAAGNASKRLECVVEGTSGATEPTWTGIGTMVTDNTVTWIVDDVRDGTPVGRPVFESVTSKAGYIKANGALLNRADYPRLWSKVQTELQVVTDAEWTGSGLSGRYSSGNGATTFRVPDLRAEFIRGLDDSRGIDTARVLGSWQADIFKSHYHTYAQSHVITGTGNIQQGGSISPVSMDTGTTGGTETRPRNIAYLALIKY